MAAAFGANREVLLGAFAGPDRLIAGEPQVRAPCGRVADRGDVEASAVCAMNLGDLRQVAGFIESVYLQPVPGVAIGRSQARASGEDAELAVHFAPSELVVESEPLGE